MFALFYSLYYSMFVGAWSSFTYLDVFQSISLRQALNDIGKLATSIFGDNQVVDFGQTLISNNPNGVVSLTSFILALITSIGIVVMAVKGIKRAFSVFFMGIR